MTCYLLAAEADKIQDLIFRSSRLREVVGASQLLTRFCREVPAELIRHFGGNVKEDIIICDGGSFRIIFDKKETAEAFGEYLSESYRIATGGSLTIANPVKVKKPFEDNFIHAMKEAEQNLRRAKRKNNSWHSQEHMPYMAICTSCGTGLAKSSIQEEGKQRYRCTSCLNKISESKQGSNEKFLDKTYSIIAKKEGRSLEEYTWPGKGETDPTEDVAVYDPNGYVAYLVADGNGMGEIFGSCPDKNTLIKLSNKLDWAICKALAEPARKIMEHNSIAGRPNLIPVLPLILGGDELFALIPAPWALDFTLRFCQIFEIMMDEFYKESEPYNHVPSPTISATVIICKNKHPYTQAYEKAKTTMKKAKQLHRKLALYKKEHHSIINFEIAIGSQPNYVLTVNKYRPTLKPYLSKDIAVDGWSLPLRKLVDQRWHLRHIPSKRLHELQNLYDTTKIDLSSFPMTEKLKTWQNQLKHLTSRIDSRNEIHAAAIRNALEELGGAEGWLQFQRSDGTWSGHGLPDLLSAWDYTFNLDRPIQEYEEE